MLVVVRRFVIVVALFFWQGGFTFYAAVVVPIGQEVFTHRRQGFVTQRVTNYLNLSGAIALVPLAWELLAAADPVRRRRQLRALLWLFLLATLIYLVWLHPQLDELLDPESRGISDRGLFRLRHRLYLWISTMQWGAAGIYLLLTLLAWRAEDQQKPEPVLQEGEEGKGEKVFRR
jgi:hypothetical protein